MSASSVASVGVVGVCPGRGRVGPVWEGPVVRAECRVGAPAPWDPLDDGEDYVPGIWTGVGDADRQDQDRGEVPW